MTYYNDLLVFQQTRLEQLENTKIEDYLQSLRQDEKDFESLLVSFIKDSDSSFKEESLSISSIHYSRFYKLYHSYNVCLNELEKQYNKIGITAATNIYNYIFIDIPLFSLISKRSYKNGLEQFRELCNAIYDSDNKDCYVEITDEYVIVHLLSNNDNRFDKISFTFDKSFVFIPNEEANDMIEKSIDLAYNKIQELTEQ